MFDLDVTRLSPRVIFPTTACLNLPGPKLFLFICLFYFFHFYFNFLFFFLFFFLFSLIDLNLFDSRLARWPARRRTSPDFFFCIFYFKKFFFFFFVIFYLCAANYTLVLWCPASFPLGLAC